jgi:hypothetical protein
MTGDIVRAGGSSPFGPTVGPGAMLIIRDNGASGADELNVGPAAVFGAVDCRDKPPIGGDLFTDGNFTVSGSP